MLYEQSVLSSFNIVCSGTLSTFIGCITYHGPAQKLRRDMREPKRARSDATGALSLANVTASSQERGSYYAGRGRVTYVPGKFGHAAHLCLRFATGVSADLMVR